jgi:tetratricopeptide (TPR) repeat protein
MTAVDHSTSVDSWGEPLPDERPETPRFARRAGCRRWVVGCGLLLAIAIGLVIVRDRVVDSLFASCRRAVKAEDWEGLELAAARWQRWDPYAADPLLYLAEVANQRQQYERAVELLDRLPDSDPVTPLALLERSAMQFGPLNRPLDGALTLERVLRLDPGSVEARRRLIFFYAFTLQRRKMAEHCYQAIVGDSDLPETYVYLVLQDGLSFANAYEENTRWFRGDREQELFFVARALYRIRARGLDDTEDPREGTRDERGIPFHRQVVADYLARFPQNLELLAYHLESSMNAGDLDGVARLLPQAPPEAVEDHRFWRYKGWLHAAREELAEARQSYEEALRLNPYDFVTRHQLAAVERRFKNLERVKMLAEVAAEGKNLRRELLQLDSVARVPRELLKRIASHARHCGDDLAARKLQLRLEEWSDEWQRMRVEAASAASSPTAVRP